MNKETEAAEVLAAPGNETEYAAPQIEKVITPDDLEREVHYAGAQDGISTIR